jgi:CubicO group peptidase (beta-lactamase class C family)
MLRRARPSQLKLDAVRTAVDTSMNRRQFNSVFAGTGLAPLAGGSALADPVEGCAAPTSRDDGWDIVAGDDDKAVDTIALCKMADRLAAAGANIHAVVVVHRGKLVFERYLQGSDQVPTSFFGSRVKSVVFDADTRHALKSVTKSIASLAVGIAIDRGLIRGVDEPILGFFPDLADLRTPEADRLLLRHALGMTLGLEWIESTPATGDLANDETRMYFSGDPCRYVLTRRTVAAAGQQFFYSTGALALVSAIVHRATGRPLDEFARASLLEPLGISGEEWSRVGRDSDAGGGLRMRPRDMAKIGQLVLAGGRWYGRQIVSKGWIDASTASLIKATDDQDYGYLWWSGHARAHRRTVRWIGALGRGGQSIRIVPELDLVVAVTAGYYQDYSPQAFKVQYGVFNDALQATSSPG